MKRAALPSISVTNVESHRALEALDWAVEVAERAVPLGPEAFAGIANASGELRTGATGARGGGPNDIGAPGIGPGIGSAQTAGESGVGALSAGDGAGATPRVFMPAPLSAAAFKEATLSRLGDVRTRLDQVMMAKDPEVGLDALLACGAMTALFPEVSALVGFGDGEWRHKDVWKHTKQVVRQAVPRIEVRWAALLHDIGKVRTRSISPEGEVHFFGHAEVGARMFDKLDRRLGLFSKEDALKSSIRFLILHHLRASQYDPSWTDNAVRRFAREMGPCLIDLLDLSRADITTKRPEKKKKGLKQISDLHERVRQVLEEDAVVPPLPGGVGNAIMESFGLPPSRKIGEIKRALEEAVDAGLVPSHQPSEVYVEFVRQNAERFGLSPSEVGALGAPPKP